MFTCDHDTLVYLDMFQIWACALRDAGYCERGLCLYQAMIELHMDLSKQPKGDLPRRLEAMEKTWDTDKAR